MRMMKISDMIITPSTSNVNALMDLEFINKSVEVQVIPFGTFRQSGAGIRNHGSSNSIISLNTLEPKKGHNDMIDALECLLAMGANYTLTFVGKEGWGVKPLVNRILNHSEFNKKLFWLEKLDDSGLEKLYSNASISICASEGEGFGLTLEEALSNGMKVVCRDIPVFRERNYENIFYFQGGGINLAKRIESARTAEFIEGQKIRSMENFTEDLLSSIL
jgi:glycosyltransferase involved in cell wall biosynthesis